MKKSLILLALLTIIVLIWSCQKPREPRQHWEVKSEDYNLKLEVIADSILIPFGMAFLPNGDLLVSNRPAGELIRVDTASGDKTYIKGVPKVWGVVDGGLLDLLPHPDYANNGWLYYSYAMMRPDSLGTLVVERAKIKSDSLVDRQTLFTALPFHKAPNHLGSRMQIRDGYLFITMGEHFGFQDSAQTVTNHQGKVMRIFEDGRVPEDNPFVKTKNGAPEVWSYGHRNPQGLAFHPTTGALWEHEHGPKGGDEINIITPGLNYGWPVITYGIGYDDKIIGAGITEHEGMEQPLYYYKPSIAPSGMEFYTGNKFLEWKGNLFIGAMALKHLNRLVIENDKVTHEERLLLDQKWRIRSVKQGPDGLIYVGVDNGMIVKISPAGNVSK